MTLFPPLVIALSFYFFFHCKRHNSIFLLFHHFPHLLFNLLQSGLFPHPGRNSFIPLPWFSSYFSDFPSWFLEGLIYFLPSSKILRILRFPSYSMYPIWEIFIWFQNFNYCLFARNSLIGFSSIVVSSEKVSCIYLFWTFTPGIHKTFISIPLNRISLLLLLFMWSLGFAFSLSLTLLHPNHHQVLQNLFVKYFLTLLSFSHHLLSGLL